MFFAACDDWLLSGWGGAKLAQNPPTLRDWGRQEVVLLADRNVE